MKNLLPAVLLVLIGGWAAAQDAATAPAKVDTSRGDRMLAAYFAAETAQIQKNCLAEIKTLDDWNAKKEEYRRQLREMLGLDPLPERTDLKPVITGTLEQDEFRVEKLHFQSRPGLYVTGNFYLPKKVDKSLPTILYVCGHSVNAKDGVPLGAKVGYQHHGAWFARNGYACLTIDTLQLGEIEGIHHGTHRYGMWWWLNRGYTPAGVEAWNCLRALDYLETRPEVDKSRFGVTGRSGGGAYSWWIAALDDRIKCAVPTAGITDLQNHVVDGCVEGHCDCMYLLNTYRWDYPQVAALVAPRPLLISNSDSDGIFPLDGVYRTFEQVRRIYRLHEPVEKGVTAKVALNIAAGPHKDTQELQTSAFRWFNHYLKGDDSLIDTRAPKFFAPEQLKVFGKLPDDQINTKIHETFVAKAPPPEVPADKAAWEKMREGWLKALEEKSFRGSRIHFTTSSADPEPFTPRSADFVAAADRDGLRISVYDCGWGIQPRLIVVHRLGLEKADLKVLTVLDEARWSELLATFRDVDLEMFRNHPGPTNAEGWKSTQQMLQKNAWVMMYVAPRGIGATSWDQSARKQVQNQRRFYLLGQTLDAERVWDVHLACTCAQSIPAWKEAPLWLQSHGPMAGVTLYTSLFESDVKRLDLYDLPKSHRDGPYFLNVQRYLDMPQAVAMAAERSKVVLYQDDDSGWEYPQSVAKQLGWDAKQIQIRRKPK